MRVITLNVNGLRSAERKGFFLWLAAQQADVVCLQEIRIQEALLDDSRFRPPGYHCYFHPAERKGYSGVAVYCREAIDNVITGFGWPEIDAEGRYLEVQRGKLSIASLYLPSGSSGEVRQSFKFALLERLSERLREWRDSGREYLLCGDWNIAHREIDLKNWRGNRKNSGFLPEERAWLDTLFDELGWVDAFRQVRPDDEQYTWWSNRGQAWAKNVGWRIDYHIATPALAATAQSAVVYTDERFSDHAPLTIDYDYQP